MDWRSLRDGTADNSYAHAVCIGVHLARFEIALGAITFFLAYPNAQVAPETTAADMEFENFFLIAPKSHKCLIKLNQ
jgi:hypothetical protein